MTETLFIIQKSSVKKCSPFSEPYVVKDSIFHNAFEKLDSMKVWEMKNISKEGYMACDGTRVIVHSKINGKENKFSFSSATYYHDERYNWISRVFGDYKFWRI